MRPGELLLELVSFVALLAGSLSLLETLLGFEKLLLEVRDDLGLALQHLGGGPIDGPLSSAVVQSRNARQWMLLSPPRTTRGCVLRTDKLDDMSFSKFNIA